MRTAKSAKREAKPQGEKRSPATSRQPVSLEPGPLLRGDALAEWHRVVESLRSEGRLRSWMRAPLIRYCILWSRYNEAATAVAKHGMFSRNKQTKLETVSCYSRAETDAHARLSRMEKQLGLTPENSDDQEPEAQELEL
jgi:P27 family predicted phage terminase small subunit